MQVVYDSESYMVVHNIANSPDGEVPHDQYAVPRHGFEIVDKIARKEIYLDGDWAALFQKKVEAWKVNTPAQLEIEQVLDSYCALAQLPVTSH